jgi:hypothetical protein
MHTLNKQKNKNSHKRLNNWLDMLLFWTQFKNLDIQKNDDLKEIVEEYRVLIAIPEPSPTQQIRIEEILELAVYDTVLSKLIDRVEQDIAREIGLFEENVSNSHNSTDKLITSEYENNNYLQNNDDNIVKFPLSPVSHSIQKTSVFKPSFSIPSAILGGAVALLGVYIFNPCSLLGTNYAKEIDSGASSNSKSNEFFLGASTTWLPIRVSAQGVFKKYEFHNNGYIIFSQKVGQTEKQQTAEQKQICFENKQRQAELKQQIAESEQSFKEAIKWKEEAQFYLHTAQYFRYIANNSSLQDVSLSIDKTACP